jgi:uncharacterized protein (DUF362 family)
MRSRVYLHKTKKPAEFSRWLRSLPLEIPLDRPVVLKPNLVCPISWRSGVVSDVRLAGELIGYLKELGVRSITLAEGPGLGVEAGLAFDRSGFAALARETGVPLVDLNRAPRRPVKWPRGELLLPELLQEAFYINLPKVKTHINTLVTLGLKNQKGLLSPADKKSFHREGLHLPVAQLLSAVKPDLTILDGILAIEGDGPLAGGRRVGLGVVAVGNDPLAVDCVGCRLMGIDPMEVEHLRLAHQMALGDSDPEVLGDRVEDCARKFRRPEMELLKMMGLHNQRTSLACSMCGASAREGLVSSARDPGKWLGSLMPVIWQMAFGRIDFVYGSQAAIPEKARKVIAVGECTKHLKGDPRVIWVEGCPPSPELLAEAFARLGVK